MRAVCEACGAPQPVEWKAGDLCAGCGSAVRRDVRCFWCAKWTPFAKFCRSCAAELVEERLFGAARMLKDAGTDRFTVPRLLGELDPEQVENFSRIYQRHAVAAARQADDVHFLERFLVQKAWSAQVEDDLVGQLPWDDRTLAAMSAPPLRADDDLARVEEIGRTTPLPVSRSLATLARVRLDDWTAVDDACRLLACGDPLLEGEAALALSGWRVRYGHGLPDDPRGLTELLRRSPARIAAAVRIGLLTGDAGEVPPEAVGHPDREVAFTAALARGDVDRLGAALSGEALERVAAGSRLVDLDVLAPLAEPLQQGSLEVQRAIVAALVVRRRPCPQLADALIAIVETTADPALREQAARALCRQLRPDLALRVARAAAGNRTIFQLLLLPAASLSGETLAELLAWMVDGGVFLAGQFGLEGAAERGAISDGLVPRLFARAGEETRRELLGLAEVQLRARGDEALHRFVMNVVFGRHPAATRSAAWWVLRRWYLRDDPRGEGPFRLSRESIARFFGSVDLFVPRLTSLLRDPATLAEPTVRDLLGNLFRVVEREDAAALADSNDAEPLVRALLEALRGDTWPSPGEGMVHLLGLLGDDPRWKAEAISGLQTLGRTGNHHWVTALRSLRIEEG
jgi:hypothetical protein